jgi:transposase-like protein
MPKRTRRSFTPQFKAQVVLELLTGVQSQAEICRQRHLKPELVARWKATFLERMAIVFGDEERNSQDGDRLAELERLVGRLTLELEVAKKASDLLPSVLSNSGRSS